MTVTDSKQGQIEGLATLLVLNDEIRKLNSIREFGFFSTNETHRLVPYHTAYLWQQKELIGPYILAQSGTAEVDIHSPTNQWIIHKINKIRNSELAKKIHQIDHAEEKKSSDNTAIKSEDNWPEDLPDYLLWCPLLNKSTNLTGGLIFFREQSFSEAEVKMLNWLINSFQYTWLHLVQPSKLTFLEPLRKKPYIIAATVIILGVLFFPVPISVFGDGIVSAQSPTLINAPMQGVIKSFAVSPGEIVKAGQLLVKLDKTDLQAAAEVSKKDFLLTQARFRTAVSEGFDKKNNQSDVPIIKAQLEIDQARMDYAVAMLAKADIYAPTAGVIVFESKEDWVGQPVRTGEKIMTIANPEKVQLKISIPVTNSIKLVVGDKGEFFLYGQLNPLPFRVHALGYNAKMLPTRVLAYQLIGNFDDKNKKDVPQLGAQGTVKIYSDRVPLIYYILRRPIQAIRQSIGI